MIVNSIHFEINQGDLNMKKILASGIIIVLFLFSYSNSEINFLYNGIGAGGQMSFVVSDNSGGAFGFGFHGIVEMSLGQIGIIQYNPSLCFWFNSPEETINASLKYENKNRQTSLNLFDIKYLFPVPESIFILPYAGGGLCIIIDGWERITKATNTSTNQVTTTTTSGKDGHAGFNFYGGVDFPINDYLIPFFEIRFTATSNWAFKLTGGATFRF